MDDAGVVDLGRTKHRANPRSHLVGLDLERAAMTEPLQLLGGHPAIATVHLEEQPLEV